MPPRRQQQTSLESLLPPILSLLQPPSPNPYSAHQKALTTTARLAPTHPDVAIEILFQTSRELLKLGEGGSGSELGVRMVSVMGDSDVAVDQKSVGALSICLISSRSLQGEKASCVIGLHRAAAVCE